MQTLAWNTAFLRHALSGRFMQHTAQAANIALLILIAWSVGSHAWTWWAKSRAPAAAAAPAVPAAPPAPQVDIAALHLFGESHAEPGAETAADAPETPLNLTLRGVFSSDDPEAAYAIIAGPDGKETGYALEDELPGGAVLKAVFPDRVTLMRNGRNESLSLPRQPLENTSPPQPAPLISAPVPQPSVLPPVIARGQDGQEAPAPQGPDIGAALRNYREALKANPQSLAGLVHTEPVQQDGKFMGYRLQPGADAGLLGRMGLQPGDVVTAVNGVTLDSPARGQEALRALASASDLRLTLLRNGTPHSVAFSVQE
ncbi:MAG: type II secretion system protein GspC [Gammaproteobacteria bacterium]|nr:MAG: type II secretion system protein GspC [Gammaproteobacteria bacterium]